MKKTAVITLISLFIASCGGGTDLSTTSSSNGDSNNPNSEASSSVSSFEASSSAVSSIVMVSSTPVNIPTSSSSSSSLSALSSTASYSGNAQNGRVLYEQACQVCHGSAGIKISDGGDAQFRLNSNNFTERTLFTRISDTMPPQPNFDPASCIEQCAADIAAYVKTWSTNATLACDSSEAITYSPRTLRVLTIDEYRASLTDLLGLPADYEHNIVGDNFRGGFPNNGSANVDQNSINKYWANAWDIARWAVDNDKPDGCNNRNNCASQFVDVFLPKLFRRPLNEDESRTYYAIFSANAGDDGLELAMATALTSPVFLYRSEMGIKVSDILAGNGFEPYYDTTNPVVVSPGDTNNGFRRIGLYGGFGETYDYNFTGNDIIKIQVRGTFSDGFWPTLKLRIDNNDIDTVVVDSAGVRTLIYRVEGNTGRQYIRFENVNQGMHSQARDLFVGDITFGNAELVQPPQPDEDKLRQANPDAYVLDSYEYATLISFVTTGSTPDDVLLLAAKNGDLEDTNKVLTHVNRLLDTARGKQRMGDLVAYWFGTDRVTEAGADRDNTLYPNYTPQVRSAMASEVRRVFQTIFYDNSGTRSFDDFYGGDFTVLNKSLAEYYGIDSTSRDDDDWKIVDNLEKRGGFLTTGAFMSLHAHPDESAPILRAAHLRRDVLCQQLESPPLLEDDRAALLERARQEDERGTLTTAGYYNIITDSPACNSCHEKILNPLFGMEDFGPTGLWRTTEKGSTGMALDIDNSGILYGPNDINNLSENIQFNGAKALSKIVASLPGSRACLIDKTFRYVSGLPINVNAVDETTEDSLTTNQSRDFACAYDKAEAAYQRDNHNPRAVFIELIMQDLMRYRLNKSSSI